MLDRVSPSFFPFPPFIVDDSSLFNRKLIIDRRVDFKLDRRRWKDGSGDHLGYQPMEDRES